jgi:hypothetical protein
MGNNKSKGSSPLQTFFPKTDAYVNGLKKQISELRGENSTLRTQIEGELVDGSGNVLPEPGADATVNPNDTRITYDSNSGLSKSSQAYNNLYGTYYRGYKNDENIIINQLQPEVDYLKKTELTGIDFSFDALQNQNTILTNQIQNNTEIYSTDMQKVTYQSDKITSLKSTYLYIFIVFYVILAILIYVLFAVNTTMSRNMKIGVIIVFALYPFYANVLQQLLYFIGAYLYAIFNGDAYTSNNY